LRLISVIMYSPATLLLTTVTVSPFTAIVIRSRFGGHPDTAGRLIGARDVQESEKVVHC
jgi:hypothetical protein